MGQRRNAPVQVLVLGGDENQDAALEIGGEEFPFLQDDAVLLGDVQERRAGLDGDNGDVAAGLEDRPHPARRHLAAADDQHRAVLDFQKQRQMVHDWELYRSWAANENAR